MKPNFSPFKNTPISRWCLAGALNPVGDQIMMIQKYIELSTDRDSAFMKDLYNT